MTTPDQLIAGFQRFRERHFAQDDALYQQLAAEGQTPSILVVACCDARVDPALVLDCAPGDLFVIRNVANLVPPSGDRVGLHGTSAALEFGIRDLKVRHVIVLGHSQCGGIRALMNEVEQCPARGDSFIGDWMRLAAEAREQVKQEFADAPQEVQLCECERRTILISIRNLKTFPWVAERLEKGELALHGWYFDISSGQLLHYNEASESFEPF